MASRRAFHLLTSSRGISFTLLRMANRSAMKQKARSFKEASLIAEDVKQSAVLRYLATIDPTGEKLKGSDKIKAIEHCKCTIADVEYALAKYTRARKLREEGKPYPTTYDAVLQSF